MTFTTPFETDKYTVFPGDAVFSNLSFAIRLIDDYTKDKTIGRIRVILKETGKKAVRNLSGYYCCTDLEAGNYTVNISPELYFPEEITVDMSSFTDPNNPVIEINGKPEIALKPKPEYPFPANATLVRGFVVSNSGKRMAGIRVGADEKEIENITDSRGEFVLYFYYIEKEEEITLKINGVNGPQIKVMEGKTLSTGKISIS